MAGASRRWRAGVAGLVVLGLAACGSGRAEVPEPGRSPSTTAAPSGDASPETGTPSPGATGTPYVADPAHAVPPPGPLRDDLLPPDLMVYLPQPLTDDHRARILRAPGVTDVEVLSLANVGIENRVITVAAVDPATYRRYTPRGSAQLTAVWERVAGGELAITPWLARRLKDRHGYLRLGNDADAPTLRIGALAPQIPQVSAVVNERWVEDLGMRLGNALLVSTGSASPQSVRPAIERIAGPDASVQILGPDPDITAQQTAFLTGGSVASGVGSFSYRLLGGGRIAPDPGWVTANIRTERVPILGSVTCHKIVLPQLRAALTEVVQRGLAAKIHPEEYAGCYYPRFIAGTTELSLHSFGIALDLNVPGNRRGTVGEIDRTVVSIFQRWGFTWGGDWGYTDPMHFEMNAIVEPR